jgi:cell division protein FtsL
MSETKPSETIFFESKRGKVVGRNVAITLGIISIILIATLGAVVYMGYYPAMSNSATLQSQIKDLNSTYNDYKSAHSHTDSDYDSVVMDKSSLQGQCDSLQYENTNLQSQVSDLTSIINLEKSTVWASNLTISQPADSYTDMHFSVNYTGYVLVNVTSSNTDKTYAEVSYSGNGIYYDNTIKVGTNGTAAFPVVAIPLLIFPYMTTLPTTIEVRIGNTNTVGNAIETSTITYYY